MSAFANLIPYISFIERCLPREALGPIADSAGRFLSSVQYRRRNVSEKNLRYLGFENTRALARKTIRNWTVCLSDQMRSLWMNKRELQKMVEDRWSDNLVRSRGVILVSAHLGNYELGGSYLASCGLPVHAVIEEIPRGHTATINRIRRRFGMGVVPYSNVTRMIDILRQGKILVLLADRDFGTGGLECKFGNGIRSIPQGPALLALRTGAAIQPAYCVLNQQGYRLYVEKPIKPNTNLSATESIKYVTHRIANRLVRIIRSYSDQWFVFTDEWLPERSDRQIKT